jgi:transcriptional regulator with XRE-family HTH domain
MSINKNQLGRAIRDVRKLRGYSQAALGQKAGLQGNTVALIERGQRGVSIDALNDLANALNLPAACLTMLGTSELKGDSGNTGLVKSIQQLILSTLSAQRQLEVKEDRKSNRSNGKHRGVARKGRSASKGLSAAKKSQPAKARAKKVLASA